MKQQSNFNTSIGIVVALIVAGFMFYGASFLYSNVINNGQNSAQNNNQDNTMTNSTAEVKKEVLVEGKGDMAEVGDSVQVNYKGMFEDGEVFDESHGTPLPLTLGAGMVIEGWEQGLLGMKVGEKRKLTIPPSLAYGEAGHGPIPPNSTLIFEVELVKLTKAK